MLKTDQTVHKYLLALAYFFSIMDALLWLVAEWCDVTLLRAEKKKSRQLFTPRLFALPVGKFVGDNSEPMRETGWKTSAVGLAVLSTYFEVFFAVSVASGRL